jgi:hypothetical protein
MSTAIGYQPGMRLTRLSPKGQLTIPAAHLRLLGWCRGMSHLQIERVGRAIHISAVASSQPPHPEHP